uniref:Uncharacterized protein n=1 Tax=Opuntia streptacantha TaxID=393608 RepID=A0A7C9CYL3_OPUST
MLIAENNLKLLSSNAVRFWPEAIIFLHNLALGDDAAAFAEDGGGDEDLFANHGVVLIVGIVGITKLSIGSELELQKFMAEFSPVTHIIPHVELPQILLPRHGFLFPLPLSRDLESGNWEVLCFRFGDFG